MSTRMWTDQLGRTYAYQPYEASPIADATTDLSGDAALALSEASRALGTVPALPLSGIAAVLYRSEASASSLIEGLSVGPRRVFEAGFAEAGEVDDEVATRILRNLEGLEDAVGTAGPPSSADLLRWHRILTAGHPHMREDEVGAYRTEQNWIGGEAIGPRKASFIPPAPEDIAELIGDLERFCQRTDVAPLQQALIAHARFEVIHPFTDGNGRVGRMLLQHLVVRRMNLPGPVPLSLPWSQDPDRYVAGLRSYQGGDVNAWIEFAASSTIEAVEWMHDAALTVTDLIAYLKKLARVRGESLGARIIDGLPWHPILDAPTVMERYGASSQAAHGALTRLEKRGVLVRRSLTQRRNVRGRPRQAYTSPELVDTLTRLIST